MACASVPRIWRASDEPVTRYALLGGSLGDAGAYALAAGAGAVICGEAGYHVCLDLTARGCSVILIGHDASELPFASVLSACAREAGVPAEQVSILNEHRQWRSYREEEIQ